MKSSGSERSRFLNHNAKKGAITNSNGESNRTSGTPILCSRLRVLHSLGVGSGEAQTCLYTFPFRHVTKAFAVEYEYFPARPLQQFSVNSQTGCDVALLLHGSA